MKHLGEALRAALGLAVVVLAACESPAAVRPPDSEHTIWVRIESSPNGAALYAPTSDGSPPVARIGETPCVVAVDLNWQTKWFKKRWELISVWSPGGVCYARFRMDDAGYDLFLRVVAMKNGYREQTADLPMALLKYPGPDWSGRKDWPAQARVTIALDPLPASGGASDTSSSAPVARRVIVADSESARGDGTSGTLTVHADVDAAQVYVDGRLVGVTPVQAVVKDGVHMLEVRKPGHHPVRREITVNDDADVAFRAILQPLASEP